MSDASVRAFIRRQVTVNKETSVSGLLRLLRTRGSACEQSRFRLLYQEALGQ
jgi:hypothetical protein